MADLFTEVFNWIPLAHVINDRVLVSYVWPEGYNSLLVCTCY